MKAITYYQYGPPEVLGLEEVPKPVPRANELLVKVHATTVTSGTLWIRQGRFPGSWLFTALIRLMSGLSKPTKPILGYEFSGVVEAVGSKVKLYKTGDAVYGTTIGLRQGAYAEYVCVPEKWNQGVVALKPTVLSFEAAAALPVGGMTALHLLKKAKIQTGEQVLVYGASGSVGTYALQLAKYYGATVTAVSSKANLALLRSLGADQAVDYVTDDLSSFKGKFQVVFDAVGKLSTAQIKALTSPGGRSCSVKSLTSEKQVYLQELEKIISEGKLQPYIGSEYPLEEIVAAHAHAETGHKRGNLVIKVR
jgi:NADPH:quinone reductase-like Zn-dependent oxidoreductase